MTKKKKILLIGICVIVLFISFTCGQVFSKYFTKVKGEGTANIANWKFQVNGDTEKIQKIQFISNQDNQVIANDKIGPGTSGNFAIEIDGSNSEVGIEYRVYFENETNKPKNLVYFYEGQEYHSITELQELIKGEIYADEENKVRKIMINWIWPYETGKNDEEKAQNDKIDTNDIKQIQNYTFNVIVSGTQMKPQS